MAPSVLRPPSPNPLDGWHVDLDSIRTIGHDLQRPECILAERDGTVWSADARGGVMRITLDGAQQLITPHGERAVVRGSVRGPEGTPLMGSPIIDPASFEDRYVQAQGSLPNGLAFAENGDFIIANWGTEAIERLTRDGRLYTWYTEIDGQPLGKANFPLRDSRNRIWFTVTTREQPWTKQVNTRTADGYIALIDERGIRIVAEGFNGTNEIRFDDDEEWLYIVESTGRRISRMRAHPDGTLTDREVYGPSELEGHPDGFGFDSYGNLWVTLIFLDKLVAITPDGDVQMLLDDSNPEANALYEEHFQAGTLTPEIMAANHGTLCPWMASVTFGGPDLCTVYLGSLRGTTIPYFRSPVAGQPMIHWH